jgi:hypothetical protein
VKVGNGARGGRLAVALAVRSGPLRTVVNGTVVARQAKMTPGTPVRTVGSTLAVG